MKNEILQLKDLWGWNNSSTTVTDQEINSFQKKTGLIIPKDLKDFFKLINGSNGYDDGFFEFYSLEKFSDTNEMLNNKNSLSTLEKFSGNLNDCFIFADYQVHLFDYIIQLYKYETEYNDVYILCDGELKIIANSFKEFLSLCLIDSQKLFFNE